VLCVYGVCLCGVVCCLCVLCVRVKGVLQLLMNRYGYIRFAHVHERVSTKSLVVLIIGNSKSDHLGAQGTFNLGSFSLPPGFRFAPTV